MTRPCGPTWGVLIALGVIVLLGPRPVHAHPAPFSYLDIHVEAEGLRGRVVLHAIDVAHELGLIDPATLSSRDVLDEHLDAILSLVTTRVAIETDGQPVTWTFDGVEPVSGQDSVAVAWHAAVGRPTGHVAVAARLFPYDPIHQTFVTVYEGQTVAWQDVLGRGHDRTDHYTGTRQGRLAVVKRFVASGVHHIAIGPDHILFIIGLLLPGGTLRRLLAIVTAFTLGHSVTLALATLSIVDPPGHIVEPLIALSIVFVGADQLFVGSRGRDVRVWVALVFGLVHGFGFASVLRDTGLPSGALGLSLLAFNLGVEVGQAAIVVVVATALNALRRRNARVGALVATAGAWVVLLAGTWWFVERVSQGRG